MLGARVSSPSPRSGITTARSARARSARAPTSRLEPLTLSTSSAPAPTAVRISFGSKLSMLTRMPAARSSRTTSASSGKGTPGVQPTSMTSAPLARKYFAAATISRARQPGRVVDLGEDLDPVGPVLGRGGGLSEVAGNLAQVLGALLDGDAELLPQDRDVALAEARDQDQVGAGRHLEEPGDPRGGHERGHRDPEDGDLRLEGRLHLPEHPPERGLGELAGDEENPAVRRSGGRAVGRSAIPGFTRQHRSAGPPAHAYRPTARPPAAVRLTAGPPSAPICSACPPARRPEAATARPPRSSAPARSPCP